MNRCKWQCTALREENINTFRAEVPPVMTSLRRSLPRHNQNSSTNPTAPTDIEIADLTVPVFHYVTDCHIKHQSVKYLVYPICLWLDPGWVQLFQLWLVVPVGLASEMTYHWQQHSDSWRCQKQAVYILASNNKSWTLYVMMCTYEIISVSELSPMDISFY